MKLKYNFLTFIELFRIATVNSAKTISEPCIIILIDTSVNNIFIGNIDVPGSLLKIHGSDIRIRGVQNTLSVLKISLLLSLFDKPVLFGLMLSLLLLHCLLHLNRARVIHLFDIKDFVVSQPVDMHSLVLVQVSTSDIPEHGHRVVLLLFLGVFDSVKPVSHNVRVVQPPLQRLDLLNSDEPAEIVHFSLRVHTIFLLPREVEQFGAIVDLFPESLLHPLLGLPDHLVLFEVVQMREDAHYVRETMILQKGQVLECLHLKADGHIDEHERQITNLSQIYHRLHLRGALVKRDPMVLIGPESDGASDIIDLLLCEMLDEGLNERGFARLFRALNHNHERWLEVVIVKLQVLRSFNSELLVFFLSLLLFQISFCFCLNHSVFYF